MANRTRSRSPHTLVFSPRVAGVESLQPRLEQRAFVSRPDPVGSQDGELVATVLLAQAAHEVLAIVVLELQKAGAPVAREARCSEGNYRSSGEHRIHVEKARHP